MNAIRRAGPVVVVQVVAAAIGLAIALYLSAVKLAGGVPVCLASGGCETVATSEYSVLFGIPVAILGALFSAALLTVIVAATIWHDRRMLYGAYALALFGVVFVAYLTYLELFVIHAICQWCVGYAIAMIVTFGATAVMLRRTPA